MKNLAKKILAIGDANCPSGSRILNLPAHKVVELSKEINIKLTDQEVAIVFSEIKNLITARRAA